MVSTVLLAIVFIGATVATTLCTYLLMRFLAGASLHDESRELASSVLSRVAALHGLILALVFAQEMIEYQTLKSQTSTEADAAADAYFDARRYGGDAQAPIDAALSTYVSAVISADWPSLGRGGTLAAESWAAWDKAYGLILDLKPATEREKSLRDNMLTSMHRISEMRVKRENHGLDETSVMFWFAAVFGILFVALAYYPFAPKRLNLLLLSTLGGYTGIVLFFIYAFSNPFSEPASMQPSAMLRLQEQIQRNGAALPANP